MQSASAAMAPTTVSRYINTTNRTTHYNEGCSQAHAALSGIVIFDFGQPWHQNGTYGTYLVTPLVFRSIASITNAVEGYLDGFYKCNTSSAQLRLAVGTNNYDTATQVSPGHAQAWAAMINTLNSYITSKGYASEEYIRAAGDMELSWNSAGTTRAWLDAYAGVTQQPFYNYGDAAGCPPYGNCSNGWTQEDVWYVSFGQPVANAVPEIYTNDGSQADEWYSLSLYGYTHHGTAIAILSALTEYGACKGKPSCGGINNTPLQAYNQMETRLNGNSHTAQSIPYSTDITYAN